LRAEGEAIPPQGTTGEKKDAVFLAVLLPGDCRVGLGFTKPSSQRQLSI